MSRIRRDFTVSTPAANFQEMLKIAVHDGKAAAAEVFSTRLDNLATHAANEGLSATEIVELIREEAAAICSKGGAAWQ
ncbi:DUF2732 family protein [Klebsiella pneumoniae]|uniref:DUF2732 family protein n=1 Tax=Klebsiella pneumoniae TaxID=573 RepID=UPI000E2B8AF0|nr:Protein of uncharacterised function (DUF2732) [Klebsiella pneumoniae]